MVTTYAVRYALLWRDEQPPVFRALSTPNFFVGESSPKPIWRRHPWLQESPVIREPFYQRASFNNRLAYHAAAKPRQASQSSTMIKRAKNHTTQL